MERNAYHTLLGALLLLGLSDAAVQGQAAPPATPAVPGGGSQLALPGQAGAVRSPYSGAAPRAFEPYNAAGQSLTVAGGLSQAAPSVRVYTTTGLTGIALPLTPELGKKTMSVMALREMLALHISAKDLQAALPPLKDLHKSERALQTRSEQILEEEKRALLAADPDSVPPLGSEDKLRVAMDDYRTRQNDAWNTIARSIGREKAEGLRHLVEGGRATLVVPTGRSGYGGGSGGGFGGGSATGPGKGAPPTGGPAQPAPKAFPGGGTPAPRALPGDDPFAPAENEAAPALPPGSNDPVQAEAGQAPPPAGQGVGRTTPAAPRASAQPRQRSGARTPAPGATMYGGQGVSPFTTYYAPPRLTLIELIDLMEQKLNAMKR